MALKLGQALEEKGYNVVYTRSDDTFISLEGRCQAVRDADADLFVSVHYNASTSTSASGTATYYTTSDDPYLNAERQALARSVQDSLIGSVGLPDRKVQTENFYVIKYTSVPAILVETAFISNPTDRQLLTSEEGQQKFADAIAEGIDAYLSR
jgi:N-acetylmuramoyl-L-alanine amidase